MIKALVLFLLILTAAAVAYFKGKKNLPKTQDVVESFAIDETPNVEIAEVVPEPISPKSEAMEKLEAINSVPKKKRKYNKKKNNKKIQSTTN